MLDYERTRDRQEVPEWGVQLTVEPLLRCCHLLVRWMIAPWSCVRRVLLKKN